MLAGCSNSEPPPPFAECDPSVVDAFANWHLDSAFSLADVERRGVGTGMPIGTADAEVLCAIAFEAPDGVDYRLTVLPAQEPAPELVEAAAAEAGLTESPGDPVARWSAATEDDTLRTTLYDRGDQAVSESEIDGARGAWLLVEITTG